MKRVTIYLDNDLHKAIRIRAFENNDSVSSLVNEAVRRFLEADLEAAKARRSEKPVSYASFLGELKSRGQLRAPVSSGGPKGSGDHPEADLQRII